MYRRIGAVVLWVLAMAILSLSVDKHGWSHGNVLAWPTVLFLIGYIVKPKGE